MGGVHVATARAPSLNEVSSNRTLPRDKMPVDELTHNSRVALTRPGRTALDAYTKTLRNLRNGL